MSSAKLAILDIAFNAIADKINHMTAASKWIDDSLDEMGSGAPKALADFLGVDQTVVSKLRNGTRKPSADEVPKLQAFFRTKGPYTAPIAPSMRPSDSPRAVASESNDDVWVFPSSFLRESAISPTTRFVTLDVHSGRGDAKIEVTIIARAKVA